MFHSCKLWIRTVTAALVATMLTAPLASAHKTYLATERTVWEAGSEVTVGLTSALEFPDIETGPARNRIDFTSVRVGQCQRKLGVSGWAIILSDSVRGNPALAGSPPS